MKNKKEVVRFLELIANSVGETITEYHWREACGLIAGIDPYKKDSPIVVYEQMDNGCIRPYDKQSIVDRIKEAQEEYNKLLDKLNKETPSD